MERVRNLSEEEKMEHCYNLCESQNWELNSRFFDKTSLYANEVKYYACEYIRKVLNRKFTKKEFDFLIDRKNKSLINSSIVNYMVENKVIDSNLLNDFVWVVDHLDEAICKFCYELFLKFDWVVINIENFCNENDFNYRNVSKACRKYYITYLNKSEEEFKELRKRGQKKSYLIYRNETLQNPIKYDEIISKILTAKSEDEIIRIMEFEDILPSDITKNISYYALRHDIDFDELKLELEKRLRGYVEYFNAKRYKDLTLSKEEEEKESFLTNLPYMKELIEGFLASDCNSLNEYCRSINGEIYYIKKYLSLIEKYDKDLYLKYKSINEKRKQNLYGGLRVVFERIIDLIQNGIVDETKEQKRDFDLLDYYEITNLHPREMFSSIKDITPDEYRTFRLFMAKYNSNKILNKIEIDDILKTDQIVGIKFSFDGKPILGTGRKIEKFEKEQIMEYLISKNIPITRDTYNIALKKLLKGELFLTKQNKKVYKVSL